jgi:AraC-like DNA-binding protein
VNYRKNNYKIEHLAQALALSQRHLYRECQKYFKKPPRMILKEYRLHQAILLIQKRNIINIIALDVGFSSHSSFSRCFKAQFKQTPSEYLKNFYFKEALL